ncbi:MAG: hypothetical protein SV186_06795 [Candidatus Nanohaloarchaea archaeon]|nr:hypothetical protein [Candidatus Nanohaloarchaea archaeon]
MAADEDALALYRRGAILFISSLAVVMTGGGLVYYAGFADSLASNVASLMISLVGGYVLKDALIPGLNVAMDVGRTFLGVAFTVGRQLIRLLLHI